MTRGSTVQVPIITTPDLGADSIFVELDRASGAALKRTRAEGTRTPAGAAYQPLNVSDRVYLRTCRSQPGMRRFTKEATGLCSHKDTNLAFYDVQVTS